MANESAVEEDEANEGTTDEAEDDVVQKVAKANKQVVAVDDQVVADEQVAEVDKEMATVNEQVVEANEQVVEADEVSMQMKTFLLCCFVALCIGRG